MHELVIRAFDLHQRLQPSRRIGLSVSGREAVEKIYYVSFFKRLVDSNGRCVDACQGAVEVRAADRDNAIKLARKKFAELKDVMDWSLRADYEKVELLEARKRVSKRQQRRNRVPELSGRTSGSRLT